MMVSSSHRTFNRLPFYNRRGPSWRVERVSGLSKELEGLSPIRSAHCQYDALAGTDRCCSGRLVRSHVGDPLAPCPPSRKFSSHRLETFLLPPSNSPTGQQASSLNNVHTAHPFFVEKDRRTKISLKFPDVRVRGPSQLLLLFDQDQVVVPV
jgi:hypothetical protein